MKDKTLWGAIALLGVALIVAILVVAALGAPAALGRKAPTEEALVSLPVETAETTEEAVALAPLETGANTEEAVACLPVETTTEATEEAATEATTKTQGAEPIAYDVVGDGPWQRAYREALARVSEEDAQKLGRAIYGEAWKVPSRTRAVAVAWGILNQIDSAANKDLAAINSLEDALDKRPANISGYTKAKNENAPTPALAIELARDVLARWAMEKQGWEYVGRILPAEYVWWHGDGENHFFASWNPWPRDGSQGPRLEWAIAHEYDWSLLPTPYRS